MSRTFFHNTLNYAFGAFCSYLQYDRVDRIDRVDQIDRIDRNNIGFQHAECHS